MKEPRQQFIEKCENAVHISRETLRCILKDNQDTEIGKRHGFGDIKDLEDYKELPLTVYEDYYQDILRMKNGEDNVLTVYPVKHYLMTSGSSMQKYFPLTYRAMEQGFDLIYDVSLTKGDDWDEKRHLHTSVFRIEEGEQDTILSCADLQRQREKKDGFFDKYIGGEELLFSKGINSTWYVKLWLALSEPRMYSIHSVYIYDALLMLQYFKQNWKRILYDMENHSIADDIDITADVKERLLALELPGTEWFDFVRKECEKGFEGIVQRIWKDCCLVAGIGGKVFGLQEKELRKFLGDIPLHFFIYASSEALFSIAIEEETDTYVCIPDSCFMEFLPYGEEDKKQVKWIGELERGKKYELIVTNFSGLYRYRLLDIVEVVDFCGQTPVIRFMFRKNMAINIAGEKTNLSMIADVVKELSDRWNEEFMEYSVCLDESVLPNRYCFFIEGKKTHGDEEYGSFLEEALSRINLDYEELRKLGLIATPICYHVREYAHAEWKNLHGGGGHNKPLQFSQEEGFMEFMKERILEDGAEQ